MQENIKYKLGKGRYWILCSFVILLFLHVIFIFLGFYGNDDVNYARYAANIANHGFTLIPAKDQYELRWPAIVVTSIFYKLFGINEFTSSLFSFLSLSICGVLVHKFLKKESLPTYCIGMCLFFLGYSIIFYSHRLLPDTGMCLCIISAYYFYRRQIILEQKMRSFQYGTFFALALFFAMLTKETVVITIPLWLFLLLKDIYRKKNLIFWRSAFLAGSFLIGIYLLYFKLTTGEFFYRYNVLVQHGYFTECSFDQLPIIYVIRRVAYQLWKAMLFNGDMAVLIPAFCAVIYRRKISVGIIKKLDVSAFVILLLASNFMTVSLSAYIPLCHDPRHFLFLMPFASVIGAPVVYHYFKNPRSYIFLLIFFCLATIMMFGLHAGGTKYLYALITLCLLIYFLGSFFIKKFAQYKSVGMVMFCLLFGLNYLSDLAKPKFLFYFNQKQLVQKVFRDTSKSATIYTSDGITGEMSEFFLQFRTGNLLFICVDSFPHFPEKKSTFYLSNTDTKPEQKKIVDSLLSYPFFEQEIINTYQKGKTVLYELKTPKLIEKLYQIHSCR